MDTLFAEPLSACIPESVLLSIYNAYPRKAARPQALKRIAEALERICGGEIDGQPRTASEAIEFLRQKTEEARRQMYGRTQNWIPHPTTYYNQSRYLRTPLENEQVPARIRACISILSAYPNQPGTLTIMNGMDSFLPVLRAIDKALELMEKKYGRDSERRLQSRTEIYAMAVRQWSQDDLRYVPNPIRWYNEARYEHDEATWNRKPTGGFESERQQFGRLLQ